MLCIHLGPGRLGLGLVASHLVDAELPVYLVGRPLGPGIAEESRRFGIALVAPGEPLRYLMAEGAGNPSGVDDLPAAVRDRLDSEETVLITSSLGPEYAAERMPFVDGVVAARPAGAETVLVVCENEFVSCYADVAARHRGVLTTCPSVVDRVCDWATEDGRDLQGSRVVSAHPVKEWVVEHHDAASSPAMKALVATGVVVTPDLRPWSCRKLWTVNGLHQILALVARFNGADLLQTAARTSKFREIAAPFAGALAEVMEAEFPGFDSDPEYADRRIDVFCEMPDTTARILKKHLVRADLRGLLDRLDRRVFAAARAGARHGVGPAAFINALELLLEVLGEPGRYYPSPDGAEPSPEVDTACVERFAKLLDGWLPEATREAYVDRFRRVLAVTG